MKRDTLLAGMFFPALNQLKSLPLLASAFHRRLESIYFNKLFRDTRSDQSITNFPLRLPENFAPVFVLSTGRCGTLMLTTLMSLSPAIQAHHEPDPKLVTASYFYYYKLGPDQPQEFWHELVRFSRGNLMLRAHWLNRVYFESNNRMTLLADLLISIFPHAKFIHIVRHPYDFVRSAMNKGYYKDNSWDFGRVHPQPTDEIYNRWNDIFWMEKCAWLWNQTNLHILNFLEKVQPKRKMFVIAEDIFSFDHSEIIKIFKFVNNNTEPPSISRIKKVLKKKINPSINKKLPAPKYWSTDEIDTVQKHTLSLVKKFGYAT